MELTYSDLADKARELQGAAWLRRDDLHKNAQQLLNEYRGSLDLPAGAEGLVFIGGCVDGKPVKTSLVQMELDNDYRLSFKIITNLTPDDLDKLFFNTNVVIWRESGNLKASVEGKVINISALETEGRFFEVCAAIKRSVFESLERKIPR